MMSCVDSFPFLDVHSYSAVSLPLAGGKSRLIVVVPKAAANLVRLSTDTIRPRQGQLTLQTSIESGIFGSGTILHSFLENVRMAEEKLVKVSLPRLTIQVRK